MRRPEEEDFHVAEAAVADMANLSESDPNEEEAPPAEFQPPENVMRELGKTAGNTSDAAALLESQTNQPVRPRLREKAKQTAVTKEGVKKNVDLSFRTGMTRPFFEELDNQDQKKVLYLSDKMIEMYGDRGVSQKSLGVLWACGEKLSSYYLVHLGEPLENLMDSYGSQESTKAFIRYRFKNCAVRDMDKDMITPYFMDFNPRAPKDFQYLYPRIEGSIPYDDYSKVLPNAAPKQWVPSIRI